MNGGKIIAVSQKQGRFPRVMEGNFQVIIGKLSITFLDYWKIVDKRRRTNSCMKFILKTHVGTRHAALKIK